MDKINLPVVIDKDFMDFIKREHPFYYPEVLNAYHKSLKHLREKERRQIKNEFMVKDRKIKTHYGICTSNYCNNEAFEGRSRCIKCLIKALKYM